MYSPVILGRSIKFLLVWRESFQRPFVHATTDNIFALLSGPHVISHSPHHSEINCHKSWNIKWSKETLLGKRWNNSGLNSFTTYSFKISHELLKTRLWKKAMCFLLSRSWTPFAHIDRLLTCIYSIGTQRNTSEGEILVFKLIGKANGIVMKQTSVSRAL